MAEGFLTTDSRHICESCSSFFSFSDLEGTAMLTVSNPDGHTSITEQMYDGKESVGKENFRCVGQKINFFLYEK